MTRDAFDALQQGDCSRKMRMSASTSAKTYWSFTVLSGQPERISAEDTIETFSDIPMGKLAINDEL